MECINDYIQIDLNIHTIYESTSCNTTVDDKYIQVDYQLSDNDCVFTFSEKFNLVKLKIDKAYFEKYQMPFDLKGENQNVCCNTQSKLYDLISCTFDGISRKIYLESIVLYLIYQLQKNDLIFQLNCGTCSFIDRPSEMDKIFKAKDFIINNLDSNITIPKLANKVGTNECYLKKGFKEVHGKTVLEFVIENRMEKAKSLLTYSSLTIADVSVQVGYATTSSFSQAFKNYFGFAPSQLQKLN